MAISLFHALRLPSRRDVPPPLRPASLLARRRVASLIETLAPAAPRGRAGTTQPAVSPRRGRTPPGRSAGPPTLATPRGARSTDRRGLRAAPRSRKSRRSPRAGKLAHRRGTPPSVHLRRAKPRPRRRSHVASCRQSRRRTQRGSPSEARPRATIGGSPKPSRCRMRSPAPWWRRSRSSSCRDMAPLPPPRAARIRKRTFSISWVSNSRGACPRTAAAARSRRSRSRSPSTPAPRLRGPASRSPA